MSILAIDQGTTSSRAIVFDDALAPVTVAQKELTQIYPKSGWVEHDPEEIWSSTLATCREALQSADLAASDIAAIGITNQRETTVIWDRSSGKPLSNAIVWQDRRTAGICENLRKDGMEALIQSRTGLVLDPYFSATKIAWLLNSIDGARDAAKAGDLLFGTVDSFLLWRLTGGKIHATDATNAARTMLYDITKGDWDAEICEALAIPTGMLPRVCDCAADFGETSAELFGSAIPIRGIAGDQQAATLGQACMQPGMVKSTYGTGCFALLNTGEQLVTSTNRLLGTIAYQLDGKVTYALEGSIFSAGSVVQWLRDGLGLIDHAQETEAMAERSDAEQPVYLVPAFTGLGAPYWDAECRGTIHGLSRNTGPDELARAALESVGYQTRDLLEAMSDDWPDAPINRIRVDGGLGGNGWAMQFIADICNVGVDRAEMLETTAAGAAWLAGMKQGVYPDAQSYAAMSRDFTPFAPTMPEDVRHNKYSGWKDVIERTLSRH